VSGAQTPASSQEPRAVIAQLRAQVAAASRLLVM